MASPSNQRLRRAAVAAITLCLAAFATLLLPTAGASRQSADVPPVVLCSWSLVDIGEGAFAPGPDADAAVPSAPGVPCSFHETTGTVGQPDGVDEMIHVRPADDGTAVGVQTFLVVAQPIGGDPTDAVEVTVAGPTATGTTATAQLVDCSGTGVPPAFVGASSLDGSGAISRDAIERADGRGLADRCRQGDVDLWSVAWTVDTSMPCGTYEVTTRATSAGGTAALTHGVEVVCFWWLTIDFDDVNWDVSPGQADTVVGDADPNTPDAPTITNAGNAALDVGVELSPLTTPDGASSIDTFSGTLDDTTLPIPASDVTWFDVAVCPADSVPLDLTVFVDSATEPGDYGGQYTVWGRSVTGSPCVSGGGS